MNIRFLSIADQEVSDAARWYEEQAQGLSRTFLDELDRVIRRVPNYPRIGTTPTSQADPRLLAASGTS